MSKNLYQVKIDEQIIPNSFTYEELLLNGILDFDDIFIKNVYDQIWYRVSEFTFPEEQDLDISVNNPSISNQPTFEIDDCGQVINHGGRIQTPSNTQQHTSSDSTYSNTNNDSDDGIIWKIIFTIIAIVIVIVLFCNSVISGTVAGVCGAMFLQQIWKIK